MPIPIHVSEILNMYLVLLLKIYRYFYANGFSVWSGILKIANNISHGMEMHIFFQSFKTKKRKKNLEVNNL